MGWTKRDSWVCFYFFSSSSDLKWNKALFTKKIEFKTLSSIFQRFQRRSNHSWLPFSPQMWHPCLSDPVRISFTSGDKMRTQMPMGRENPLFLMGGDFEFYCLQLKKPVGISKILVFFLVGTWVQCFPVRMEFQGIFLTEDEFWANFSSW